MPVNCGALLCRMAREPGAQSFKITGADQILGGIERRPSGAVTVVVRQCVGDALNDLELGAHGSKRVGQDRLAGIDTDLGDQAIALGMGLQHVNRLVQLVLADREQIRTRPGTQRENIERIGFGGGNWLVLKRWCSRPDLLSFDRRAGGYSSRRS